MLKGSAKCNAKNGEPISHTVVSLLFAGPSVSAETTSPLVPKASGSPSPPSTSHRHWFDVDVVDSHVVGLPDLPVMWEEGCCAGQNHGVFKL